MLEADEVYSFQSIWSSYLLDQFLIPAFSIWIMSKCSIFYWICLLFILFILVIVELPLCLVTLSWNAIKCFLESN